MFNIELCSDFADCKDTNKFSILKKTKNKVFLEIEIITNWCSFKNKNREKHKKDNYKDASPMLVLYRKLMRN